MLQRRLRRSFLFDLDFQRYYSNKIRTPTTDNNIIDCIIVYTRRTRNDFIVDDNEINHCTKRTALHGDSKVVSCAYTRRYRGGVL